MNDKQRIAIAVTALAEAFRQKTTDAMLLGYQWGLDGLPIAEIERACALALQRCKFMPVPSELRELCGSAGGSFDTMAEQAWVTFVDAVRRLGPEKTVNFRDGLVNATIRAHGGWQRCCGLPRSEFDKWLRKEFIATYVRLCRDGASEEARAYHPGDFEIENAQWIGKMMPGGRVYKLGMFGSEVVEIEAKGYTPLLPSPPAQQRLAAPGTFGGAKRIGNG